MADLFDIVTARKLSGGGGGGGTTVEALSVTQNGTYTAPSGKAYSPVSVNVSGGSSDFSTATVTVTFETTATLFTPYCYDYDGYAGIDVAILESDTYTVALYKGTALASVQNGQIAGTGNIEIEGNEAIITGDCTITIS